MNPIKNGMAHSEMVSMNAIIAFASLSKWLGQPGILMRKISSADALSRERYDAVTIGMNGGIKWDCFHKD